MPIIGLLPTCLSASRNSIEETKAVSIASAIAADLLSDPVNSKTTKFGIQLTSGTVPTGPATLYFTENGTTASDSIVRSGSTASRYRVDLGFGYRAAASAAQPVQILVTWPAQSQPHTGTWPTNPSGAYEILTSTKPSTN
ncbi:MAG: hypothetical protein ACFUZC_04315 [Chthoniobacteraceae bacterium]